MMNQKEFVAFVSLDWADERHAGCLKEFSSERVEDFQLEQKAAAIQEWVGQLRSRFRAGKIAVAVEQKRGALVYALMKYELFVIFPLNTTAVKNYRKALRASGAKDDFSDARLQLLFLLRHIEQLRRLEPDSVLTRQLTMLVESRRKAVDHGTALTNQITALLKEYYPAALELIGELKTELACNLLTRWPTLQRIKAAGPERARKFYYANKCRSRIAIENRLRILQQAEPLICEKPILETYVLMLQTHVAQLKVLLRAIDNFDKQIEVLFANHPDFEIYKALPAAGPAIAPRLAAFFGEDRNRYDSAVAVANLTGIAPVTVRSGKSKIILFRFGAPKFARQSFVEFARVSIPESRWAAAYYRKCRSEGKTHQAAIRSLAYKWIRILYRCWKDRVCYDEVVYLESLKKRNSPLLKFLAA